MALILSSFGTVCLNTLKKVATLLLVCLIYSSLRPELGAPCCLARFDQTKLSPEQIAKNLFRYPDANTFAALVRISNIIFGEEAYVGVKSDDLFMKMALEQYWLHPDLLWSVISAQLPKFFVGYSCVKRPPYCRSPLKATGKRNVPIVEGNLAHPLEQYIEIGWPHVYRWLLPICSLIIGLGLTALLASLVVGGRHLVEFKAAVLTFVSAVAVQLIIVFPLAILVNYKFRYQATGVLFSLIAAAASIQMISSCHFNKDADLLPTLPTFIRRVCSGSAPDRGGLQTRSV